MTKCLIERNKDGKDVKTRSKFGLSDRDWSLSKRFNVKFSTFDKRLGFFKIISKILNKYPIDPYI